MKQHTISHSILVSTVFFAACVSAQSVMKDDLLSAATHEWTGFYMGLNIGAVNHTMKITDTQSVFFNATMEQVSDPKLAGGIQGGYRRQLDYNRVSSVYGVEISANLSDARFSTQYGSPFALYQLDSEEALDAIFLFELTGGIAVDRTLFFLGAGLSWVHITGSMNNIDSIVFSQGFDVSKQAWGTVLSGGIEYALTQNVTLRFKVDVITPHTYTTTDNLNNQFKIANNITQGTIGINYQFA